MRCPVAGAATDQRMNDRRGGAARGGRVWLEPSDAPPPSPPPIVGASRIGFVYTPPAARGNGFATASVARLAAMAMARGGPFGRVATCLLYTQLHNAGSNRIYRRIGFRSVGEELVYAFE
jgi:ribosomal protein S18 acetylase RimI-like enzyme